MRDCINNPRLAALRGLEECLLSHHRATPAESPPSRLSGFWRGAGLRRWLRFPEFLRGRRMRNLGVAVAALVAVVAVVTGALFYRLSSGPIALDFATDWLPAGIKEKIRERYSLRGGGHAPRGRQEGG